MMPTKHHRNADGGLPARSDVELAKGDKFRLIPTDHAEDEATDNYDYRPFRLPDGLIIKGFDSVYAVYKTDDGPTILSGHVYRMEVADDTTVTRLCVEANYTPAYQISLIIDPVDGVIVTAWLNPAGYTHVPSEEIYDHPTEIPV